MIRIVLLTFAFAFALLFGAYFVLPGGDVVAAAFDNHDVGIIMACVVYVAVGAACAQFGFLLALLVAGDA